MALAQQPEIQLATAGDCLGDWRTAEHLKSQQVELHGWACSNSDDDDGGGGDDIIIRYLFANVRNRITHDLEIGILPALQEAEAEDAMGIRPDEEARKDLSELTSCIEFIIVLDSSRYFFEYALCIIILYLCNVM